MEGFTIEMLDTEALFGYKQITTFYQDFSIAEKFLKVEPMAIKDTYRRAFNEWKHDYKYLTELVMVLNWKCHRWFNENRDLSEQYNHLWEMADEYACKHLKGEELEYFYDTTD